MMIIALFASCCRLSISCTHPNSECYSVHVGAIQGNTAALFLVLLDLPTCFDHNVDMIRHVDFKLGL